MLDLFQSREAGRFGRRQKRARGARIPVTVVTGFLGAGKTTLIRQFLKTPQGRSTAVLINEFGAVGIDDALVRASTEDVVLLGNGCMCCVTRTDLQLALGRLVGERERGQVPQFDRILIETSGLADPGPILQTFSTDRALGDEFFIEVVVTIVDAATGLETLQWSAEARKQAILADCLVISKADLVDEAAIEQVRGRLRSLNADAAIDRAIDGHIDPLCLTEALPQGRTELGFIAEAAHTDGVGSFVHAENGPVAWEPFARGMDTLIALRGPDLLRVKGFLDVEGCRGPVLVQFVQHLAHPPVELAAWPRGERGTRLVFITRGIAKRQVLDLFAAVRGLARQ